MLRLFLRFYLDNFYQVVPTLLIWVWLLNLIPFLTTLRRICKISMKLILSSRMLETVKPMKNSLAALASQVVFGTSWTIPAKIWINKDNRLISCSPLGPRWFKAVLFIMWFMIPSVWTILKIFPECVHSDINYCRKLDFPHCGVRRREIVNAW